MKSPNSKILDHDRTTPLEAEVRILPNTGISILFLLNNNLIATISGKFTLPNPTISLSTSPTTNSPESWSKALRWLKTCSSSHKCWTSNQMRLTPPSAWPARILLVGTSSTPFIKIQPVSPETGFTGSEKYLTLSHCWGSLVPITLLKSNLSEFSTTGISIDDLPPSFKHAVEVTRLLSIKYIWIDSLCIVQDSARDWAVESLKMHRVYRNSWLNLAAGGAGDCHGGFWFERDVLSSAPMRVQLSDKQEVMFPEPWYNERDNLKLFTRGWVYQEQLLARRMLIFGREELHWECGEVRVKEFAVGGEVVKGEMWLGNHGGDKERFEAWGGVVEGYSEKALTRFSDRLIAVSGLAAALGEGWRAVKYLAGLWSYRFRHWMLWQATVPSVRPVGSGIPTWSWASLQGPSHMDMQRFSDGLVEVVDVDVNLAVSANVYGAVDGGTVKLQGYVAGTWIFKTRADLDDWSDFDADDWAIGFSPPTTLGQSPLDEMQMPAMVSWDEKEMQNMAHSVFVYLVPFEVNYDENVKGGLSLVGLILLPTYLKKGQFRRVGKFAIEENPGQISEERGTRSNGGYKTDEEGVSAEEEGSDHEAYDGQEGYDEESYGVEGEESGDEGHENQQEGDKDEDEEEGEEQRQDENEENASAYEDSVSQSSADKQPKSTNHQTYLELMDQIGDLNKLLAGKAKEDDDLLETLRGRMQDFEVQVPESERNTRLQQDPFFNGDNDKKETFRHYEHLDPEEHPRIFVFLNSAKFWSQTHSKNPGKNGFVFESSDEDGWHVFEIV
ncbi:heterokaryon incompatibility protein-domain-containing protein [Cladorrhinum sp. PSN332]|nr:heterokaryon incompatibility protein-domain-containing protein [Cladorrhinum sp. PSN332]